MRPRAVSRKASGQSGSAGSGQRAAQMTARHAARGRLRPPDVQRRDVPVPDRLLAAGVGRDAGDRQIDFDQALGIGCGQCHTSPRCES